MDNLKRAGGNADSLDSPRRGSLYLPRSGFLTAPAGDAGAEGILMSTIEARADVRDEWSEYDDQRWSLPAPPFAGEISSEERPEALSSELAEFAGVPADKRKQPRPFPGSQHRRTSGRVRHQCGAEPGQAQSRPCAGRTHRSGAGPAIERQRAPRTTATAMAAARGPRVNVPDPIEAKGGKRSGSARSERHRRPRGAKEIGAGDVVPIQAMR